MNNEHKYLGAGLSVLAFSFPVYIKAMPVLIALYLLLWIFCSPVKEKFHRLKKAFIPFIIFSSLFFIYLASMLWTQDQAEGWMKIETSLSLTIFPALLFSQSVSATMLNNIFRWYILGCTVSMVACYSYATFNYFFPEVALANKWSDYDYKGYFFWKDRLSPFLHTSYISMFLNIAIALLVFKPGTMAASRPVKLALLFFFSLTILLLSSRSGIIVFAGVGLLIIIKKIREGKLVQIALSGLVVLAVFAGLYFGAEQFQKRFTSIFAFFTGDRDAGITKSLMRFEIWPAALETALENLPMGTGIGDANDELMNKYAEKNMQEELALKVNAHNQFLQTAIAAGIAGLLALLLLFFYPFVHAIRNKDNFYLIFILIAFFNFIFEAMLQTQTGVISFAFINTVLFSAYLRTE